MDSAEIKDLIRTRYGGIAAAAQEDACCAPAASSCCGSKPAPEAKSLAMGYSEAELAAVPEGANLGLGCGNPQAIAALRPGEVVMGLHSMAGYAGGFLGPLGVGWFLDLAGGDGVLGWGLAFGHLAVVTLAGLWMVRWLGREPPPSA